MSVIFLQNYAVADDWPQWLGSQRDAEWREAGILEKFPDGGPKLRWSAKIGGGYSGPAVAKGRVIVMDRLSKLASPLDGKLMEESPPKNTNFVR
ncbi:MAG: hypothetical protein AAF497_09330, partial [Planctomycetota bacterium]